MKKILMILSFTLAMGLLCFASLEYSAREYPVSKSLDVAVANKMRSDSYRIRCEFDLNYRYAKDLCSYVNKTVEMLKIEKIHGDQKQYNKKAIELIWWYVRGIRLTVLGHKIDSINELLEKGEIKEEFIIGLYQKLLVIYSD